MGAAFAAGPADSRGVIVIVCVCKGHAGKRLHPYSMHVGGNGNCVTKSAADETRVGFKFCRFWDGKDGGCKDYDFLNDNS